MYDRFKLYFIYEFLQGGFLLSPQSVLCTITCENGRIFKLRWSVMDTKDRFEEILATYFAMLFLSFCVVVCMPLMLCYLFIKILAVSKELLLKLTMALLQIQNCSTTR